MTETTPNAVRKRIVDLLREEFDPTPQSWPGPDWHDNAEQVADLIIAFLSPAPASGGVDAVAVKALEWTERHPGSWVARAIGLLYVVVDRQWWIDHEPAAARPCESDEAAKTAAQADYEQRIRSALSPAATPVSEAEPVAWVFEWKPININNQWQRAVALSDPRGGVREYRNVQPLYLAKPASSPAGGDVREAFVAGFCAGELNRDRFWKNQSTTTADAAWRDLAALSQSAGRVGE